MLTPDEETVFLTSLGIVLSLFGLVGVIKNLFFLSRSKRATGRVVKVQTGTTTDGTVATITVEFITEEGESVRFISGSSSGYKNMFLGQLIDVFYDPEFPSKARINTLIELWGMELSLLSFGSVLLWMVIK